MNKNENGNTENFLRKAAGVPEASGLQPAPHILEAATRALENRKKRTLRNAVYSVFSFRIPVYQAVLGILLLLLGLFGTLNILFKEDKIDAETGRSDIAVIQDSPPAKHLIKIGISCKEDPLLDLSDSLLGGRFSL